MSHAIRYITTLFMTWFTMAGATAWAGQMTATASIRFQGSSTLHDFEGTAEARPFTIQYVEDADTGKLIVTASTSLDVGGMTTNNKKRDKNMAKMFDQEHYTMIQGDLEDIVLAGDETSKARLHLRIRNVEKDIEAVLSNLERSENGLRCTMTFPVILSEYGLKAPSVLGVIKVADTVQVECTINATESKASAGS